MSGRLDSIAMPLKAGGAVGSPAVDASRVKHEGFPSVFYQTMLINGRQDGRTRVHFDIELSRDDYELIHRKRLLPKGGFRELRDIIHGEIRYFDGKIIEVGNKGVRSRFWLDPCTLVYELLSTERVLRVHVHRKHLPVTRSFANFSFIFLFVLPSGVLLQTPAFQVVSKETDRPAKPPKPRFNPDGTKRRIRKKREPEPPSREFIERSAMISEVLDAVDASNSRKRIRVEVKTEEGFAPLSTSANFRTVASNPAIAVSVESPSSMPEAGEPAAADSNGMEADGHSDTGSHRSLLEDLTLRDFGDSKEPEGLLGVSPLLRGRSLSDDFYSSVSPRPVSPGPGLWNDMYEMNDLFL